MLRTLRLDKLGSLSRAFGTIPLAGRIVWLVVNVAIVSALLAGFAAYQVAEGKGYDRGVEEGKVEGFENGRQDGLATSEAKRREGFDHGYSAGKSDGYSAGKSTGYSEGYDKATQEVLDVMKKYLPGIIQTAYNNGRASAPVYVPSFDFGSIHCSTYDYGYSTSIDCY